MQEFTTNCPGCGRQHIIEHGGNAKFIKASCKSCKNETWYRIIILSNEEFKKLYKIDEENATVEGI